MPDQEAGGEAQALARLCAHFGIATEYDDIWGTRHRVAPEILRALLSQFDVAVGDLRTATQALEELSGAQWAAPLPAVVAIPADSDGWSVTLRLAASQDRVRWRLREERGAVHEGEAAVQDMAELSRSGAEGGYRSERRLTMALRLGPGYHQFSIEDPPGETLVVSAPQQCWRPAALREEGKIWGPAVQLYALRSRRNWGIGDFSDLSALVAEAAGRGAGIVGLNPLHALFPHNPAHASPYSPSSRRHLNVLYIDVEAVSDFAVCEPARRLVRSPEFQARLARLREAPLVDYAGVAEAKFEVLELLYACFAERHLNPDGSAADDTGAEFASFVAQRGEALFRHALFEALQAHFHAADQAVWGWQVWPEPFRDPAGTEVAAFAVRHAGRVRFHQYLQWQAALQLARAAHHAEVLGMGVGLYLDLAVSVDRAGSGAWSARDCFAEQAGVGAPPDEFNLHGQGWGLPPLRPDRLRATRYRLFVETLRANMVGAGALRIDHVMGLMRLFWIPAGHPPADGTYVHYRLQELLSIVALESQRNRCMVIGEDLGTVADEVRTALASAGVLSYRLLYFERGAGGDFKSPADYPRDALVAVGTHDLPTLPGWWCGHDLQLRQRLGLFPSQPSFEQQLLERAQDRVKLLLAVQRAGLLTPEDVAAAAGAQAPATGGVEAIHAFLAQAPSAVMMVQLEDVLGQTEQANLPGTTNEHPNWQRKLPLELEALPTEVRWLGLGRRLATLRPRRAPQPVEPGGTSARVPRATYRLQLHREFGFDDAIRILPYLDRLGVSHVYCSPVQRARAGSTHGYDVVAHDEINPELGGAQGLRRFIDALRERGMGLLLDMVPNHMGVLGDDNAWWMDVLENGPASVYAQHFDIDWQPLNRELEGKVLLPLLGDHYGDALTRGEIVLQFEPAGGTLVLRYFEHRFPLAPDTYPWVLDRAQARLGDTDLSAGLASIATAFGHLPGRAADSAQARAERDRDKELLKARLARLAARQPAVAQAIAASVAQLNLASARDELHALIEAQAYRLAYWRVAADEINYRRFFDISELAALRIERDDVFETTQSFALDLAAGGAVDGLRIDHPDGLNDPARYFAKLQAGYAARAGLVLPERDSQGRPSRPLYVVAEKIAAGHEEVPESWHVHGTTGYRFANVANGVLVDTAAAARFVQIWHDFTGQRQTFAEVARVSKRDIMRTALASELNVLSAELLRIARADRRTRDYTLNALRRALADVVACLPVYRTYIIDAPSQQDLHYVNWAVKEAERHSEDADLSVFAFLRQTLLGQCVPDAPAELSARVRRFATRLQQFSAPVAAKGVEDTAFYRYFPLSSLNEVGGEPAQFGMTVPQFHEASADRCRRWPHTMLATSTHDHKRSEDVRNRINVLSEMPAAWRLALRRWRSLNRGIRDRLVAAGAPADAPSAADEYLLYQTLLGTLPPEPADAPLRQAWRDRVVRYMLKAAREAKLHTRWTHPDEAYEAALEGFVDGLLSPAGGASAFLTDLHALGARVAWFGALNSLSTTLLKHTSPGVPDLYQGHEVINLTLVDPDNRRPVDYERLGQALADLQAMDPGALAALAAAPANGLAKLWIAWRLLRLRRQQPDLFRSGDYQALETGGRHSGHVLAYARRNEGMTLVVIAGRLWSGLPAEAGTGPLGEAVWSDTWVAVGLPHGTALTDVLSGRDLTVENGRIAVGRAFSCLPAAALVCLA
ncbi:MAG TPA: malto-oligosyltrehalose synthase [Ramlibacter sp.]